MNLFIFLISLILLSPATSTADYSPNGSCNKLQVKGIKSEYRTHDTLEVTFQNTGKDATYFIAYLQVMKEDEGRWYQIDGGLEKIGSERTQIHELQAHKSKKFKIGLYRWFAKSKLKERSFRVVYKYRYDRQGDWECSSTTKPYVVRVE
ncbi:immunoglobulin-like domain-containing protein [Pontibacter amylolyticus]|uniref:immunoglobulin-like domain-containing protein n=1 Tax=Pontibacter amylolyticus TaxID=1424080 RepID=UPI003571699D